MEQPNSETFSCDLIIEIIADGSEPIEPRPPAPLLSAEEQAFADAVKRYQIDHQCGMLNWRNIFEIVQSLGYRKSEQPPTKPPQTNGSPQDPAHPDGAGNEKPS